MIQPKPLKDGRGRHLYKHGLTRTREYKIWCKMHERCSNPRAINYSRYGGRGIKVCNRWRDFQLFFNDMGECPVGLTIERNDNTKDYVTGNCRWATTLEQNNNKRNNVMVEFQGKVQSIAAWCRELKLNYHLIRQRIYRDKWTPDRAFSK